MRSKFILSILGLIMLVSIGLIGCDDSQETCDKTLSGLVEDEAECNDFAIADGCSSFNFSPPNCNLFSCTRNCPETTGD